MDLMEALVESAGLVDAIADILKSDPAAARRRAAAEVQEEVARVRKEAAAAVQAVATADLSDLHARLRRYRQRYREQLDADPGAGGADDG